MEEGEFVKWKQIVVGLISIMMIFTSVRGEVNENQRSNYQMLEQIEKSYVVDSGFRESNYFFLGIWRGNPRPFNDRDESAACFYHAINLPKA